MAQDRHYTDHKSLCISQIQRISPASKGLLHHSATKNTPKTVTDTSITRFHFWAFLFVEIDNVVRVCNDTLCMSRMEGSS